MNDPCPWSLGSGIYLYYFNRMAIGDRPPRTIRYVLAVPLCLLRRLRKSIGDEFPPVAGHLLTSSVLGLSPAPKSHSGSGKLWSSSGGPPALRVKSSAAAYCAAHTTTLSSHQVQSTTHITQPPSSPPTKSTSRKLAASVAWPPASLFFPSSSHNPPILCSTVIVAAAGRCSSCQPLLRLVPDVLQLRLLPGAARPRGSSRL